MEPTMLQRERVHLSENVVEATQADSERNDKMKLLFQKSLENVTQAENRAFDFIKELVVLDWNHLDASTLNEFKTVLLNLVTSDVHCLKPVLRMLLKKFIPRNEGGTIMVKIEDCMDDKSSKHVHLILQNIFLLVPMSSVLLQSLLVECFPYILRDTASQACYIHNLLKMIDYLPLQKKTILEIIINHITKLDVYCPKHDILEAGESSDQATEFHMEMDESCSNSVMEKELNHVHANTLDVLMRLMFKYIQRTCYREENLNWEKTEVFFWDLWRVFDKLVLTTHACCHVQFLLFYICSFKLSLAESFLNNLWKKFIDPNTASILRQTCAAYIGSFLSRSNFIPCSFFTEYLEKMSQWIHKYIGSDDYASATQVDINRHGPFYSICQTLFYVFVFRHKELTEQPKGYAFLRNLNFQRIITCLLNPLKVCLPNVVRHFDTMSKKYELACCSPIIEKNLRTLSASRLNAFFPFDPYILPKSREFITPIFNEYQKDEEETAKQEIDEDEFLEAPLVSPDTISSIPDFLVYSTSPQFKLIPT